jgi:hypothetical protein
MAIGVGIQVTSTLAKWGHITGDVSSQTDIVDALYTNASYPDLTTIRKALDYLLSGSPVQIKIYDLTFDNTFN